LMNHKQGEQCHWQELCGDQGGQGGGAVKIPKTDPLTDPLCEGHCRDIVQDKMPTAQGKLLIDKLRDHMRKKQHHRIDLGGTSAHDRDHNGQFGEHKRPAMLKHRQLQGMPNTDEVITDNLSEFENSAVVELGRDKET
jgi:hypothetical protein